ncbi:helix-turn-helix transcriptional regulator [Streptomyces sp. NPDC050485]|uniref:helix-turn-helix transcriptional regulator n=1 Tax=Streptomyces sp. NPDC050485 TaxID=3365617 RepID=UPI00379439B4
MGSPPLRYRPPRPGLRPHVLGYFGYHYPPRSPQRRLVFPDTACTVVFGFDVPVQIVGLVEPVRTVSCRSRADLPFTTALLGHHEGGVRGVAVRLTPMGAYRLFGIPMHEWDVPHLDPVHLLPPALRHLPERLEAAPDWPEQCRLLDEHLGLLLVGGPHPRIAPEVACVWRELDLRRGMVTVRELAGTAHCSVRHLERRFREQVGRSPAAIARVLRFRAALRLRDSGLPPCLVAQRCGFHDQAHYNHVFKATTGLTPTQVLAVPMNWSTQARTNSPAWEAV